MNTETKVDISSKMSLNASKLIGETTRHDGLDMLRGFAMVWMTVFHFCFDLANARFINQNFYADPFWTWQRSFIVSLFLLCAGMGQAVAVSQGQTWPRFWRRWGQIVACAALVSLGSWLMFPKSFIYFGVLHAMAVMLIVARLTAFWGRGLWLAGGLAFALFLIATNSMNTETKWHFLNEMPWNVLGIISVKPITEDYVPLLPWMAVMWWGVALGQWLLRKRPGVLAANRWQGALVGRSLAGMGRWSLSYYMVHQPLLLGLLAAWTWCAG